MANLLVFEDKQIDKLYPITVGRPAYAVTCACFRLYDFLEQLQANVVSLVRPHLATIQRLDFPVFVHTLSDSDPFTVVVSARLVPSVTNYNRLKKIVEELGDDVEEPTWVALDSEGNIAVAVVPTLKVSGKSLAEVQEFLTDAKLAGATVPGGSFDAVCFPHDLIHYNQSCFGENLEYLIASGGYQEIQDGLFVAPGVKMSDNIVVDSSDGPVIVDAGAVIGPYTFFAGPVYVGPNCKVIEHASIKDFVCLTNTVKAGGEIEASVIEPFSNKQHHGFLGHAYLGSWINFGAGTCNSDLKNTYGSVNMIYGDKKVSTGMQFVGCVVGDYSKTAINTSVFTGKLIGVCSNLYGFVSSNVPSYVNYAKSFGEVTLQTVEVMRITQQRMFARRNVEQRSCDVQLLADMFELTRTQRPDDLSRNSPTL